MCQKPTSEKHHNIDCVNQECGICRNTIDSLKEHYQKPIDLNPGTLKFKSWEYQDVQVNVRKENSFQVELRKKQMIVEHEKTFLDVLESLHKVLDVPNIYTNLWQNCFTASWQNKEVENLKNKIVQGDVLCVLDFAQNYATVYKDEIKSTHYGKQQITMHLILCYY